MNRLPRLCLTLILLSSSTLLAAAAGPELRCSPLFADNMVLQRGMIVPVWGWSQPNSDVSVEFAGESARTTSDAGGRWRVSLQPMKASSEGRGIHVSSGGENLSFTNVLVGEVWLASGQSNMEWPLRKTPNHQAMFPEVDRSLIRVITVKNELSRSLKDTFDGTWVLLSSPSGASSTAVGSFFAMNLVTELNVPVGIISSSWGGSFIEPWIPLETYNQIEGGEDGVKMNLTDEEMESMTKAPWSYNTPAVMHNAMIQPLVGVAMRGVIWYQGESNVGDSHYESKMKALIDSWRGLWGNGAFPFYFVQLAPHRRYTGEPLARLWEAQFNTVRTVENTGIAVLADCKQIKNIHPKNKPDVGKRLALWALANTYGKEMAYSGPLYRSCTVVGDQMIIEFDHAENGLANDGPDIAEVFIRGVGNETFVKASPSIDGSKLIVSHPEGKTPLHVRMGWNAMALPTLMNAEGLPASPFRTDRDDQ